MRHGFYSPSFIGSHPGSNPGISFKMKYRIKYGDNERVTYGRNPEHAWEALLEFDIFIQYTGLGPDDLIPEPSNEELEAKIREMPIDPWLRYHD